ncbi:MAG: glycosyltransferase family 2 protein [Bryobacterales bacterium]|nr:glycosyltransferase family 2 protein [Bryobacterales bacterium]
MLVSIITAAYNEERNLPVLYLRLAQVLEAMAVQWEWIVVDDHSSDGTFQAVARMAAEDPRVRGIRLSRNFGSHAARTCGLHHAGGACAIAMAADLQDPPETIPALLEKWREGAQLVTAVRSRRLGETAGTIWFSRLYHWIMRSLVGMKELPAGGGFHLMDRRVLESFLQFRETRTSAIALAHWMGFRQASVTYEQQPRLHGHSGWTLEKKINLVVDSVTAFSFFPVRLMSCAGVAIAASGFLYSAWLVARTLRGHALQGWAALMAVVLILGGMQMIMIGILGEYLWSALAESRRRPRYLIEESVGIETAASTGESPVSGGP